MKTREKGKKTRNRVKMPNIFEIDALNEMKIKITQKYYLEKTSCVFFQSAKYIRLNVYKAQ